jgi:hypothetical protein
MQYIYTIGLAIFEALALLATYKIKTVGLKRGAAVTGWIALFAGVALLSTSGKLASYAVGALAIAGIVAILAILSILVSGSRPNVYLSALKGLFTGVVKVGWLIGFAMPIILAIFGV